MKEKLDAGFIKINYVSMGQQIVDSLTKGLAAKEYDRECDKMGMTDI